MERVCATKGCTKKVTYEKENKCKKCISKLRRIRYTTDISYYINNRYNAMKQRAEGRSPFPTGAVGLPCLSRQEFLQWFEETKSDFYKLWEGYKDSEFSMSMAPSIDRMDNDRGYEKGNLQWLTHSENSAKRDR